MPKTKIHYISNLKVLLTFLVVLHHAVITYGGPGSWYFKEKNINLTELIPMTLFASVNQSFFMGMFFFLSALFIASSWESKGPRLFIADRLKRLGIPLVFYSVIISPVINFITERYGYGSSTSFGDYLSGYRHWIDFGVMWFVAALLLFTMVYVAIKMFNPASRTSDKVRVVPESPAIFLFALSLGVLSFLVRIVFPVGWTLSPLGFQLGHFPQYIALFWVGIIASRGDWLDRIASRSATTWVTSVALLIGLGFPMLYFVKEATGSAISTFSGGLHWQGLVYALWEQLTGISIIVLLIILGKRTWNYETPLLKILSRNAYGVYIFHPIVLVSISLVITEWGADPMVKLLVAAPSAMILTFLVSHEFAKIPGVKSII